MGLSEQEEMEMLLLKQRQAKAQAKATQTVQKPVEGPTTRLGAMTEGLGNFIKEEGPTIAGGTMGGIKGGIEGAPLGPWGAAAGAVGGAYLGGSAARAAQGGMEAAVNFNHPEITPSIQQLGQKMHQSGFDMAMGELFGHASVNAAKMAPGAINTSGKLLADGMAKIFGQPAEYFEAVFKKPEIINRFEEKVAQMYQVDVVKQIEDSVRSIGNKFRSVQDSIAGFPRTKSAGKAPLVNVRPALESIVRDMERNNYHVPQEIMEDVLGRPGMVKPQDARFKHGSAEHTKLAEFLRDLVNLEKEQPAGARRVMGDPASPTAPKPGAFKTVGGGAESPVPAANDPFGIAPLQPTSGYPTGGGSSIVAPGGGSGVIPAQPSFGSAPGYPGGGGAVVTSPGSPATFEMERKFSAVLSLKRRIDDAINYGVEGAQGLTKTAGEFNRALKSLRSRINLQLRAALPAGERKLWDSTMKSYEATMDGLAFLKKNVMSDNPHTTVTKILRNVKAGVSNSGAVGAAAKMGQEAMAVMEELHDAAIAEKFHRPWARSGARLAAFSGEMAGHLRGLASYTAGSPVGQAVGQVGSKIGPPLAANPGMMSDPIAGLVRQLTQPKPPGQP